jgi:hypothetical protein
MTNSPFQNLLDKLISLDYIYDSQQSSIWEYDRELIEEAKELARKISKFDTKAWILMLVAVLWSRHRRTHENDFSTKYEDIETYVSLLIENPWKSYFDE